MQKRGVTFSLRSSIGFFGIGSFCAGFSWAGFGLVVLLLAVMSGCSSTPKEVKVARQEVRSAYEMQKPVVMRTSKDDDRPGWTKETVSEAGGKIYFAGAFLNGSDYAVTVRCANAEALKIAAQEISQFIRVEFSEFVQGENVGSGGVERYVSDGIAVFVRNLHMQGVRQREVYYEEVMSPAIMQPTYNIWVKLEMSKSDYLRAKADMLRKLRDRFRAEGEIEAKEKAERLLDQLKRDVDRAGGGDAEA